VKGQMALFEKVKVEIEQPQPPTMVRIGKREARVPPLQEAQGSPGEAKDSPGGAGRERCLYRLL